MVIKFKIYFEDGTFLESHDENWNEVYTHAHALYPHNEKRWIRYELISSDGHRIGADFRTGQFNINGAILYPPWNGIVGDKREDGEGNEASDQWRMMRDLPYFPIIGKRVYEFEMSELKIPFIGWKSKIGGQKVYYQIGMMPDGTARLIE